MKHRNSPRLSYLLLRSNVALRFRLFGHPARSIDLSVTGPRIDCAHRASIYDSSFIQFADSKAQYCVVGKLAGGPITYVSHKHEPISDSTTPRWPPVCRTVPRMPPRLGRLRGLLSSLPADAAAPWASKVRPTHRRSKRKVGLNMSF